MRRSGAAKSTRRATRPRVSFRRFVFHGLTPLTGQPAYDTSYVSHREIPKHCLSSYRDNRYLVPYAYSGKSPTRATNVSPDPYRSCKSLWYGKIECRG